MSEHCEHDATIYDSGTRRTYCEGCGISWGRDEAASHVCDTGVFDRSICPAPCGLMHSYCGTCGKQAEECGGVRPRVMRPPTSLVDEVLKSSFDALKRVMELRFPRPMMPNHEADAAARMRADEEARWAARSHKSPVSRDMPTGVGS